MTAASSARRFAAFAAMVALAIAWTLWKPAWAAAVPVWLAHEVPWLARLLARYQVLIAFGTCWAFWREPRIGPLPLVLLHVATAITIVELRPGRVLGALLALLALVALVAQPWPNRRIIARCMVLAALVTGVDALVA